MVIFSGSDFPRGGRSWRGDAEVTHRQTGRRCQGRVCQGKNHAQQECIPVGCQYPGVCLLAGRDVCLPSRGLGLLGGLHPEGRPPVNGQTGVKILPSPAVDNGLLRV